MKKLILGLVCFGCAAVWAQDKVAKPASEKPMAGWTPRKVTHPDKAGIAALFKSDEEAMKKNDMAAMAANVDFPVYMVTDDSKGVVTTESWSREQFIRTMTDAMQNMPKDMKMQHQRKYDFITDDLALVHTVETSTMGKNKMTWNNANLVIKRDGQWKFKSMMEGGWGDMAKAKEAEKPTPRN